MMNMNNSTTAPLSERNWLHKWIDLLDGSSLAEVEMILKQYAARDMNRRYREEQQQK